MTILYLAIPVLWTALSVAAYRLGLADGLSAAKRGRLAGGRDKPKQDLLTRIDAYDGRKERHE